MEHHSNNEERPEVKRDEKGRFLKGSTAARRNPVLKNLKECSKQEIMQCAASLTRSISTLDEESQSPDISRLQHLTNEAVKNKHYKFIHWLVEMAIGKPKQIEVDTIGFRPTIIKRVDGSSVELGFVPVEKGEVG